MEKTSLTTQDWELIDAAESVLDENYEPGMLVTSAALRSEEGSIYTGLGLRTNIGGTGVHAEPVALGNAAMAGEKDIDVCVAVTYSDVSRDNGPRIVAPCGICRELLREYSGETHFIFEEDDEPFKMKVSDVLPFPAYPPIRQ